MAIKVGINGFGRIGRQVYRAIREYYDKDLDVVAVNDIGRVEIMTHLLKYDTNYGRFPGEVAVRGDGFVAGGDEVKILAERDPARLPWRDLGSKSSLSRPAYSGPGTRRACTSTPGPER